MNLVPTDPLAIRLTAAIRSGALDELARLLDELPELADARIAGRRGGWRTPLHVATDWPGYFPNGPAVVRQLIEAGSDPSAPSDDGPSETPRHWAASSDDVEVAAALIDGGADIEALGGSIAGGGPLANAVGYGCWHVARLLVARGARVDSLWQAAALGLHEPVLELLAAAPPPTQQAVDDAFWQACHGGQLRMAEVLLARGANIDATPDYSDQTALQVAGSRTRAASSSSTGCASAVRRPQRGRRPGESARARSLPQRADGWRTRAAPAAQTERASGA